MAEFITKCPHCNAELQAQDEWIGMEVECPECQKTFTINPNISAKVFVAEQGAFLKNKLKNYVSSVIDSVNTQNNNSLNNSNELADKENYFKDKLGLYVKTMGIAMVLFVISFPCVLYWTWGEELKGWGSMQTAIELLLNAGATLSLMAYVVTLAIEAYLLYEFISSIPQERQRQNPLASALLMLLPCWCYLWNFLTLPRIASDLKNEVILRNRQVPKNLYFNVMAHCIFSLFIFFFGILICSVNIKESPAAIIGSILYCLIIISSAIFMHIKAFSGLAQAAAFIKEDDSTDK